MILVLCMTCRMALAVKPGGEGISHGVCPECREDFEREIYRMRVADPESPISVDNPPRPVVSMSTEE